VFKSNTRRWSCAEITNIKAGESGMRINDKPVLELQVLSSDAKKGFLGGREEQELRWLATELRRVLRLSPESETAGLQALNTESA